MSRFNKQKTIDKIVDDFGNCRMNSYWFPYSETQIEWSSYQDVYLILHQDKTWDYAELQDLHGYVEDLKVQDLKNYLKESA